MKWLGIALRPQGFTRIRGDLGWLGEASADPNW